MPASIRGQAFLSPWDRGQDIVQKSEPALQRFRASHAAPEKLLALRRDTMPSEGKSIDLKRLGTTIGRRPYNEESERETLIAPALGLRLGPRSYAKSSTQITTKSEEAEEAPGLGAVDTGYRIKRGLWSPDEDDRLLGLVQRQGPNNWVRISQQVGHRSPKQCRARFHERVQSSLDKGPITPEEGNLIRRLVEEKGKNWGEIARVLNRSQGIVKAWWHSSQNRPHTTKPVAASYSDQSLKGNALTSMASAFEFATTQPASLRGPIPSERPFKCDQCTQSFNRNHDLKRHKRTHLTSKPFPCEICDKKLSRLDALVVSLTFSTGQGDIRL